MIRKLLTLLIAIITFNASAQLAVGSWKLYSVYGPSVSQVIDSKDRVYYLNSGFLYGYDKKADGALSYDRSNTLSDVSIDKLFYNHDAGYLLVAYHNGNIDLLYDNEEVVNLPEIKDATLNISPVINDVAFEGDDFYLATNFGLVHYDGKRNEVKQSGVYNRNLSRVLLLDDYIVVVSDNKFYSLPRGKKFNKFENFKECASPGEGCHDFAVIDPASGLIAAAEYSVVKRFRLDNATGDITQDGNFIGASSQTTKFKDSGDKIYFANAAGIIYSLSRPDGSWTKESNVPEAFGTDLFDTCNGLADVWVAGHSGIAQWNLTDGDNPVMLRDRYKPSPTTTVDIPAYIIPSTDGDAFFTTNLGRSLFRIGGQGEGTALVQLADKYEAGNFMSIAAGNVTAKKPASVNLQRTKGPVIINPTYIVEDPDDPSILYMSSGTEGIYAVKDGAEM